MSSTRHRPPPDFVFAEGATAPLALRINRALFASPDGDELLPYLGALDTRYRSARPPATERFGARHFLRRLAHRDARCAVSENATGASVLVVGECGRPAEIEWMLRVVEGIVRTDRRVFYASVGATEHEEMSRAVRASGWRDRVALSRLPSPEAVAIRRAGLAPRALTDWRAIRRALRDERAFLDDEGVDAVWSILAAKDIARRWHAAHSFESLVTRTTYLPLSAALLSQHARGPRLTVAFQHSVVTCPASHVPVPSKRLVCFGRTSADLLAKMDREISTDAKRPRICGDFLAAGSLLDRVPRGGAPRDATVLVVDQTSNWAGRYFGGSNDELDALVSATRALCREAESVRRVLIRVHPQSPVAPGWRSLADEYPNKVTLSHRGASLEEDLARASALLGLFSTVLPVAAAGGIPTFFLWKPGWYSTPDLAPFFEDLFVAPGDLVARVGRLFSDSLAYGALAERARAAGAEYFKGGKTCDLDASFVERMLAPV